MWPPTGLIPWFSKTEGNTYATLLHHPFPFKEIQRSAQEVAVNATMKQRRQGIEADAPPPPARRRGEATASLDLARGGRE